MTFWKVADELPNAVLFLLIDIEAFAITPDAGALAPSLPPGPDQALQAAT